MPLTLGGEGWGRIRLGCEMVGAWLDFIIWMGEMCLLSTLSETPRLIK